MKTLFLFGALMLGAAPLLCGCPATPDAPTAKSPRAAVKPQSSSPRISGAAFRSLKWNSGGGYYSGRQSQLWIDRHTVRLRRGHPKLPDTTLSKPWSQSKLETLVKLLNDAQFLPIARKPSRPAAPDEVTQDITLVLQEPGKKPVTYSVISHGQESGYGPALDASLSRIVAGLGALRSRNFSPLPTRTK